MEKDNGIKLNDLIEEYGANGCIRIDRGSGSAGPCWVSVDDIEADEGLILMYRVSPDEMPGDNTGDNIRSTMQYVIKGYESDEAYASDWIDDPSWTGYEYRILF